ncbi:MAG TPA: NAD+ synthase [Nitrosopumilaceae archaeon]|nr:NAD+ synthase [Nitrosopumilaceae archaeon]
MNKTLLEEIIKKDYQSIQNKIKRFLIEEVIQRQSSGVIFGLSGGIDSAVIASLCATSLKDKSLALLMPDSKVTPRTDTEDALELVDKLGLDYKLIDISLVHSEYSKYLEPNSLALGNLRARIRSNILYYYANSKNLLVLGSSDRSEYLIGYFTKFGDGAADLLPIVSLYKTQIREFAKSLGVPESIISKKSSPSLWQGHTAEDEIGLSYEEVDLILYSIIDKKLSLQETADLAEINLSIVDKIHKLYKKSEHKRITATSYQL